jgi:perosamine synthetase
MDKFIPLSVPNLTGNELKYVTEAVESQWVSTAGASITKFEDKLASYLEIENACACQSGTAGLHLCLVHFGIGQGDIVLVPTLTFIATINAVMYEKAKPVFFDCDDQLCINVNQIKGYLENDCFFDGISLYDKQSGSKVKAIIPVHIFGDTCQMDELMELAEKYHLIVIEDATESLGTKFSVGKYKDQYTGTIGDAGVFSFNGNKIITTGGGGMIVARDNNVVKHLRYLSQQSKDDTLYFIHNEIGYNYRMTNIQAALGIGQIEKLDEFIATKKKNYELYCQLLKGSKLGKMLNFRAGENANYWFYSFYLRQDEKILRDEIIQYLEEKGIQVRPIWKLNHTQKPFIKYRALSTNKAENYYSRVINLPCSSNLSSDEVKYICKCLIEYEDNKQI